MTYLLAFLLGFLVVMVLGMLFKRDRYCGYNYMPTPAIPETKPEPIVNHINTKEVIAEFEVKFKERNLPQIEWFQRLNLYCSLCNGFNMNTYFRCDEAFEVQVPPQGGGQ
jgi:hypothetical protein